MRKGPIATRFLFASVRETLAHGDFVDRRRVRIPRANWLLLRDA
jgi:hypothetical protein